MSTSIGINGACGRMGMRILQLALEDPGFDVTAALEAPGHPHLGRDIGDALQIGAVGVTLAETFDGAADVVIDFSSPAGTLAVLPQCAATGTGMVIGTTGMRPEEARAVEEAAASVPILMAPNMSLGVNVLFHLVSRAAALLDDAFDVEIIERHHRFKKDAPSGTALRLAERVTDVRGPKQYKHGRQGLTGERRVEELGIHALRTGDVVGEHTVVFSTLGETVELAHTAHSRDCFVRGALRAAAFIAGREPGLYDIGDVLGL